MKINVERNDVLEWLDALSAASASSRSPKLWKRVHSLLAVPARRRVGVNVYKINKSSKEGDNVVVPGKVLSLGTMDHKVNIAAVEYSKKAAETLNSTNCKIMGIKEMINQKRVSIIK